MPPLQPEITSEKASTRGFLAALTDRTVSAGREVLTGGRQGWLTYVPFLGPAMIASIAYMDPGNFATNIQAGAQFGYLLLWVVLSANIVAMFFQSLSAKLGIVTGRSLAEQCREHFPPPVVWSMWMASEVAAMATDVAEFLGAAIGLSLLFNLPLILSMGITGAVVYAILLLQGSGFRPMEIVIGGFVSAVSLSYLAELFIAPPNWASAAYHSVTPQLAGSGSVVLAVGIIGATVMPHAIYLHSSLTKNRIPVRDDADKRRVLKFSSREVLIALGLAGLVNMAMVAMSATAFYFTGHQTIADIETAYHTLIPLFGIGAAGIFMFSLLVSGFSSSVVGTMAGQTIMQDFVRFRIPIWLRRLLTMIPSFVVVAIGVNTTEALILSQVVLSLVLPIPMIALLIFTARRDVMGDFANSPLVNVTASVAALGVLSLNVLLLLHVAGIHA